MEIPAAEALVSPQVKALPAPDFRWLPDGLKMAVSGTGKHVQSRVLQGIELALCGWDFEAYRHFCVALAEDPECLLAHWGIALALVQPDPATAAERTAAVERMAELAHRRIGSELERGYAFCLLVYYRDGAASAAESFRKLAGKFPNDPLPAIFAALLGRGGFDPFGQPNPDQERAERLLRPWVGRHADNPLLQHAWLLIRAESGAPAADLERARALCRMAPEMPTFQHLLGHYEWRCGNFREAAAAFGRSTAIFEGWMKAEGIGPADCPGWVTAEAYRSVALASAGDFDAALAAARQLAAVPVEAKRVHAAGSRALLWEARTLGARLLLARGQPGDAAAGLATLPKPGSAGLFAEASDVRYFYQGLATVLEALAALEKRGVSRAGQLADALTAHGTLMAERRAKAEANGELSEWRRALDGLQVLASALRGDIAMAGPQGGRGSAYNWFLAASDRQQPASMLLPPVVLEPMRARVGDYLRGVGRKDDAAEAYREALRAWPGNRRALAGLAALGAQP